MQRQLKFVCLFLAAAFIANTQEIRNGRVVVAEERVKPGEARTIRGDRPSVVVYLDQGAFDVQAERGKARKEVAQRGDAVFQEAEARTVRNVGSTEAHLARIGFVGQGSDETWGADGLSPRYRMLFENRYARVYEIRIAAGETEPPHSHKDRVVVCLAGAEMVHVLPDGRKEASTLKAGEILWRSGGSHVGQNVGKTDLWVVAIEPK